MPACGSILCLSPETFGSSENLPVVERRVLPQDSGGQQGELFQIRSGRLSAERRKKKTLSQTLRQILSVLRSWWWSSSVLQAVWKGRWMFTWEARWRDYKYVQSISPHVFTVWFESLSLGTSAVTHAEPQKCAASGLFFFSILLIYKGWSCSQDSTWASLKLFHNSFVRANMARLKK